MSDSESQAGEIRQHYREYIRERTMRFGKFASVLALIFPTYYLIQDHYLLWYPVNTVPWRTLPVLIGVALLVLSMGPLARHRIARIQPAVYYLFLTSLMAMMCGVTVLYLRFQIFNAVVTGMLIVIIVIAFGSMGGFLYLFPVYALPFAGMIVYLLAFETPTKNHFIILSNPLTLLLLCSIFAEVQNRLRFREFRAMKLAEFSNLELAEKNRVIQHNNAQMQEQMNLARIIQHSIIPKSPPPMDELDIHAIYMPMMEIGGDLYDFIQFKEKNLLGVFIADVTGHGVPAALITSMLKTLSNMSGREKLAPADFLQYLNDRVIDMGTLELISAFYAIYDVETMTMRYARAGHCPPYLVRGNDAMELPGKGALLGVYRGQIFQERSIRLMSGDKMIFFTDGLIEAENRDGVQFAETMVTDLRQYGAIPIRELVNTLYDNLIDFVGEKKFEDDVCILGIEVK
ncbi:MAG: SpoIIE family protein phosphatase [Spirochaetes bacterium]|nr:SpoIIE family protein phosphatase [Spirochaetota bacterium]